MPYWIFIIQNQPTAVFAGQVGGICQERGTGLTMLTAWIAVKATIDLKIDPGTEK